MGQTCISVRSVVICMHLRSGRCCSGALGAVELEVRGQREPGAEQGVRVWRAPSPEEAVLTGTFLWPPILQGLFFDDSYGFYPGQVLIGPAKIFSSVQWLSGVKPVLSTKSKFRVLVEEVGVGAGQGGEALDLPPPLPHLGWGFSEDQGNPGRARWEGGEWQVLWAMTGGEEAAGVGLFWGCPDLVLHRDEDLLPALGAGGLRTAA